MPRLSTLFAAPLLAFVCSAVAAPPDAPAPGSSTAPTAGRLTPEQQDMAWQRATAKYAPERRRLLARMHRVNAAGPYRPDWQSLMKYKAPTWFRNAKFGIFIHWGVFSVPAFANEWYPRNMYRKGTAAYKHHIATYGPQATFGYKDFIPMFRAQHFDPDRWMRLFKAAGARYVVPVAEHSDGFAMYNSRLSDWTAVKMGPKQDVVGEVEKAARKYGLHFGLSSHRAEHDWFFHGGREINSDVNDPRYAGLYGPAVANVTQNGPQDLGQDWTYVSRTYANDWAARAVELIDDYHPDFVYFDWWIGHPAFRQNVADVLAYIDNEGERHGGTQTVVTYKNVAFARGAGTLDVERGQLAGIQPRPWETDTSISNKSWGYIRHDDLKTPGRIVRILVDTVSKNGSLLLNVGPKPDGTIPAAEKTILRDIGHWMKANGGAIYGTRPWQRFGEGPTDAGGGSFHEGKTQPYTPRDFRFTEKHGALYAIEMAWPKSGETVIHAIKPSRHVRSVTRLADGARVKWTQKPDGLHLDVGTHPVGDYAWAYRITFDKPVHAYVPPKKGASQGH